MHRLQDDRGAARAQARVAAGIEARVEREGRRTTYRGRFAPTPSGPLHFGSVVTALASFLQARHHGGAWHVRIDDLDGPRAIPGASSAILRELERLGLGWDGPVTYQSRHRARYEAALARLAALGCTFPCACTRREVGPGPYSGRCRSGLPPGERGRSVRLRVHGRAPVRLVDGVQGCVVVDVAAQIGDFIVRRADGLAAYHLAAVVDDAELQVTEVVRGADLLPSSAAQVHVQQALGLPTPRYVHVPVATTAAGLKLSKASAAPPTAALAPGAVLGRALAFLGQPRPAAEPDALTDLLASATAGWTLAAVPRAATRVAPPEARH